MELFVSLSAVDRISIDAYLKLILSFVQAHDYTYDAAFRRKMTQWRLEAQPFLDTFKLPQKRLDYVLKEMLVGKDPDEDDKLAQAITAIVLGLKDNKKKFEKELDLSKSDLAFLNDIRLMHLKGSESAVTRITKVVSQFNDSDFNIMFTHDEIDNSAVKSDLEALVRKHGKVSGLKIPAAVLTAWQVYNKKKGEKKPEHIKYLKLKSELSKGFKKSLMTLIRMSGKQSLPVHEVIRTLDSSGIPHNLPSGFVGLIDDNNNFYTMVGKKINGIPAGLVVMNPKYDAQEDDAYVCTSHPEFAEKPARMYTEAYKSKGKSEKFEVVMEMLPTMNGFVKKWRQDMALIKKSKIGVMATLVDYIYETSSRVSSANAFSHGSKTHGATTIELRHIKMDDHKVHIRYTGKSEGLQHHIITFADSQANKRLGKNLEYLMKGKGKTDPVFDWKGKIITGNMLNKYLQSIGMHPKFTVHKFRTGRATKMALALLKKSPFKKGGDWTDKEVNAWLESQLLKVGAELGHRSGENVTSNTAIQNYIMPELLGDFYEKLGIRPPAKIQKAIDATSK